MKLNFVLSEANAFLNTVICTIECETGDDITSIIRRALVVYYNCEVKILYEPTPNTIITENSRSIVFSAEIKKADDEAEIICFELVKAPVYKNEKKSKRIGLLGAAIHSLPTTIDSLPDLPDRGIDIIKPFQEEIVYKITNTREQGRVDVYGKTILNRSERRAKNKSK